jgi:hypothetical protein
VVPRIILFRCATVHRIPVSIQNKVYIFIFIITFLSSHTFPVNAQNISFFSHSEFLFRAKNSFPVGNRESLIASDSPLLSFLPIFSALVKEREDD